MSDPIEAANSCPARLTVTPRCGAPHSGGYACRVTGGHCVPDDKCDARRATWADYQSKDRGNHDRQ